MKLQDRILQVLIAAGILGVVAKTVYVGSNVLIRTIVGAWK